MRAITAEVNILSDFFHSESDLIDNIITSTPRVATLEHSPWDQLLYLQDETHIRLSAINAALDPVFYAQAISNIADETDFACSMVLAHKFLSKTYSDQLFVMEPLTPFYAHYITAVLSY